VVKAGKQLIPTFTAFSVNSLMEQHFPDLVDTRFTAQMEQVLDEIAEGSAESLPYLQTFFLGDEGLEQQVGKKERRFHPREIHALTLDELNARVRIGRYGAYLEQDVERRSGARLAADTLSPGDLTVARPSASAPEGRRARAGGYHPKPASRFCAGGALGPYVQHGANGESGKRQRRRAQAQRVSLRRAPAETVTLEQALAW